MTSEATDHRRATAERNVAAILDAAEALLDRQAPVTIAAVAGEAGVSRVTVYSHFPDGDALLEAVVARAVRHAAAALAAARLDSGTPVSALRRMIEAGWQELARHTTTAQAAVARLGAHAMTRSHHAAQDEVAALVQRGRADGSFRTDVPAQWLVASAFALFHTCAAEVHAGRLDPAEALHTLTVTVTDLFTGTQAARG